MASGMPVIRDSEGNLHGHSLRWRGGVQLTAVASMTIEQIYEQFCNPPGYCDIHEHLPTLRRIAESYKNCRILELGVREGKSTSAFLAAKPALLISVDIDWSHLNEGLKKIESDHWIASRQDSCYSAPGSMGFDILFVDTLHNEKHVRAELAAHLHRCTGHVIFHDTVTNGKVGDDGGEGIWKPIEELIGNGWELEHHYENNNGLTVLRRCAVKQEVA
jgi:hypothetical protein